MSDFAFSGSEDPGAGTDDTAENTSGGDLKTYRFTKSKRDFGGVVPVAGIETSQGFVARDGTIQLSEEEVAELKSAGHTFTEAQDEEASDG